MRALCFILILWFIGFEAVSGNLTIFFNGQDVSDKTITVEGKKSDDAIKAFLVITNTSPSAVQVKVRKTEIKMEAGTLNSFCLGECYPPSVMESVNAYSIGANQSTGKDIFYTEFSPNGIPGISEVKYEVIDISNRNNSVSVTISYVVKDVTGVEEKPGNNTNLQIFPIPVCGEHFTLKCTTALAFLPCKLEILSASGILLLDENLIDPETRFQVSTSGLCSGWYIATLSSKGKIITQRKFIIQR